MRLLSRSFRRPRGHRSSGQALVEFAVVIPIVLLLFMGIFDLARLAYEFNAVSDAARNGVREAIVNQTCAVITTDARQSAPAVDLSASTAIQVTIYKSPVVSSTPAPDTCSSGLLGNYGIGYLAEVRATTTYTPITPIIGQLVGPITVSSAARLPIERAYP